MPDAPAPDLPEVDVAELAADRDAFVLDVREPDEFEAGHVPGALLMPMETVPRRYVELPHDRVYVICAVGSRSRYATQWLRAQGVDAVNVLGGTDAWQRAGRPVDDGAL